MISEEIRNTYEKISEGLLSDPADHRLFIRLGDLFVKTNKDQAYLAYENALFHCEKKGLSSESSAIRKKMDELLASDEISVRNTSFVILSYNTLKETRECIESIRATCPAGSYEMIIVDNGSSDGSCEWLREQSDITLIENATNAGFPAGCNQGIKAADSDNDIFLLNNDTILFDNSLFWLRTGLYKDNMTGASGAVTNCAGNDQSVDENTDPRSVNIPMENPYESKAYLVMFAMLIKRDALDKTGLLDERFTPGNFEDNDYGIRLMENGYDCILCHNSFIFHHGSKSFGKDVDAYLELYTTNREKFRDKWGFYSDEYTKPADAVEKIALPENTPADVLVLGSGLCSTMAKIKYLYPHSSVCGVESSEKLVSITKKRYDVIFGKMEDISYEKNKYDIIIFSDLSQVPPDVESFVASVKNSLKPGGRILA